MKTFRVSFFGRKIGDAGMFVQLPWLEIHDVKDAAEAVEKANLCIKDTYEYLGFARCEPFKVSSFKPFMVVPMTAFAVGI
jgi:hypothetical protein